MTESLKKTQAVRNWGGFTTTGPRHQTFKSQPHLRSSIRQGFQSAWELISFWLPGSIVEGNSIRGVYWMKCKL